MGFGCCVGVTLKHHGKELVKYGEPIANCILARDYKGFSNNQDTNGVIEVEQSDAAWEHIPNKEKGKSEPRKGLSS